jgi:hypothetical protein
LGVLVTEIEFGTLVYEEDANYELLSGATKTIKAILDKSLTTTLDQNHLAGGSVEATVGQGAGGDGQLWDPWGTSSLQDFEANFWLTLSEHPSLLNGHSDGFLACG